MDFLIPDWPAPRQVQARVTTRRGGVSSAPYASFNLGTHVGDDPAAVAVNRAMLREYLPADPVWLAQVHGRGIVAADESAGIPEADGSFTKRAACVCAVLTADCLPVLFCDRGGSVVAAAHAGWRGLAEGVLEAAVASMAVAPGDIMAWLGPAIGPQAFEVGAEVRAAFMAQDDACAAAFLPAPDKAGNSLAQGKWLADIYQLARIRLARVGVKQVFGGDFCTHSDAERFYSYRRDGVTGRMASLIWLDRQA